MRGWAAPFDFDSSVCVWRFVWYPTAPGGGVPTSHCWGGQEQLCAAEHGHHAGILTKFPGIFVCEVHLVFPSVPFFLFYHIVTCMSDVSDIKHLDNILRDPRVQGSLCQLVKFCSHWPTCLTCQFFMTFSFSFFMCHFFTQGVFGIGNRCWGYRMQWEWYSHYWFG